MFPLGTHASGEELDGLSDVRLRERKYFLSTLVPLAHSARQAPLSFELVFSPEEVRNTVDSGAQAIRGGSITCLLYTSDAADE